MVIMSKKKKEAEEAVKNVLKKLSNMPEKELKDKLSAISKKSSSDDQIWKEFEKSLNEGITINSSQGVCVCCNKPFTDENVYSEAGWRETKITQMCEKCFDDATLSDEDINE